jgi:hypothetical protein
MVKKYIGIGLAVERTESLTVFPRNSLRRLQKGSKQYGSMERH